MLEKAGTAPRASIKNRDNKYFLIGCLLFDDVQNPCQLRPLYGAARRDQPVSKTGQLSLLRTVYKLFILQKKAAFKGKVDVEWVQRYIQAIVRKEIA